MMNSHRFIAAFCVENDSCHERVLALLRHGSDIQQWPRVTRGQSWFVAVQPSASPGDPDLASYDGCIAVGTIRLDNRRDIAHLLRTQGLPVFDDITDLGLALRLLARLGPGHIRKMLGDFGFVMYDPATHKAIAARDALGVKPLYYVVRGTAFLVSSRAELLANLADVYDERYMAHFLVGNVSAGSWSPYAGVTRLLHGHFVTWAGHSAVVNQYWSPAEVERLPLGRDDACEEFRRRLGNAVYARVCATQPVWAELSGGTDSSSIVVTAHQLALAGRSNPLSGTVTYVDSLGTGDESFYADAVVAATALRNERVRDYWAWRERDDGELPSSTDEPLTHFPFFAREQAIYDRVHRAGGSVLLSGQGADHYLEGNLYYIADYIARLSIFQAASSTVEAAFALHQSFWRFGWWFGILPLLPLRIRQHARPEWQKLPSWIAPSFARRQGLRGHLLGVDPSGSPSRSRFTAVIRRALNHVPNVVLAETPHDIEVRYPFLDRRLIELVLGLDPRVITDPKTTKPILRQAMHGLLPEVVLRRSTKGNVTARFLWSLEHERECVASLLDRPILAELGFIVPAQLRAAVEAARCGRVANVSFLLSALALETWLTVRAGRWGVQHARQQSHKMHAA